MNPELMTRDDAADYLGITKDTLAQMASRGIGPQYAKLSGRVVRYRRADIDAWIESKLTNTAKPVSDRPRTQYTARLTAFTSPDTSGSDLNNAQT